MISIRTLARSAACVAVIGMNIPMISAEIVPVSQTAHVQIVDIALVNGMLQGQLLSTTGHGLSKSTIELRAAGERVAETKTEQNGAFQFPVMKTGLYEITSPNKTVLVRTWQHGTAPPQAKSTLLITDGSVVRGQGSGFPLAQIGLLGVTGAAIGVGVSEGNKDTNKPNSP